MLNALFDVVILSQEEVCNCTESHPVLISHGDSMSCNDEYTLFRLLIINSKNAQTKIIMKQWLVPEVCLTVF